MSLRHFIALSILAAIFCTFGCGGVTSSPNPGPGPGPAPGPSPQPGIEALNHIIFMVQENRSFDEYFGMLNAYRQANGMPQDVDGLPATASNPTLNGKGIVPAFHMISACTEAPSPSWNESHVDFNRKAPTAATATMDGFVTTAARTAIAGGFHDKTGMRAMGFYDSNDLPYYYFIASNFATSDRWFSPVMSRTDPNRMYLLSGTSAGHAYALPLGSPPLTNKTIFQLLDENNISWKIYVTNFGPGPLTFLSSFNYFSVHPEKIVAISEYLKDVANGTLPQVAMIEPGYVDGTDEHPAIDPNLPGGDVQAGAKYVASLIDALMKSPSWKDSAFILTYDEFGGFYDHVPPKPAVSPDGIPPQDLLPNDWCTATRSPGGPTCDFTHTGFRVPLMVVSPFSKKSFVSHTVADYTAILKLIETRFKLPSLTKRDAAQMDMTEFFDFANAPWATPPTTPTQAVTAPCYLDHLP